WGWREQAMWQAFRLAAGTVARVAPPLVSEWPHARVARQRSAAPAAKAAAPIGVAGSSGSEPEARRWALPPTPSGPGTPRAGAARLRGTGLVPDGAAGRAGAQRGQCADQAQGEHGRAEGGEGLGAGGVPAAAAAVAARGGRGGRLVRVPGAGPAQRADVGGPAAARYRAGLRAGAAPGVD